MELPPVKFTLRWALAAVTVIVIFAGAIRATYDFAERRGVAKGRAELEKQLFGGPSYVVLRDCKFMLPADFDGVLWKGPLVVHDLEVGITAAQAP